MSEQNHGAEQAAPVNPGPLWKYVGIFVGLSVLFYVIFLVVDELIGGSSSVISILAPFFAAMAAVDSFVKTYRRVMTPAERWWLIWWSFGITVAWSVVVGVVVTAVVGDAAVIAELGMSLVVLLVIGAAITFLMIWLGYTFWPKRALKNRLRYEERQAAKGR